MRGLWTLVVAAACSETPAITADAGVDSGPPPPLHYTLGAGWNWPSSLPEPTTKPTLYIDGVVRDRIEIDYESAQAATGQRHVVELRYDALLLASQTITIGDPDSCVDMVSDAFWAEDWLCAYANGELRFAGEAVDGRDGSCAGDGFCIPRCRLDIDLGCLLGRRCTSIYTSLDPLATRTGCAPIGIRGLGESCSLVTSYAGIHDNCGSQLMCVAGTCKQICRGTTPGCTSCSHVPGHAPEVAVCD